MSPPRQPVQEEHREANAHVNALEAAASSAGRATTVGPAAGEAKCKYRESRTCLSPPRQSRCVALDEDFTYLGPESWGVRSLSCSYVSGSSPRTLGA